MRYQRLILEAGGNAVTVRFHPRLTVIAGVGRAERDSLLGELLGALAGGRGGAHLEIVDDGGRRLAAIRPGSGDDRVIEPETGRDVTAEFRAGAGPVDLLAHLGLTRDAARRRLRLSATDVAAASRGDVLVAALAALDQVRLWTTAERVEESDLALQAGVRAMGAAPEDAPMIEEIERRHRELQSAQRRYEDVRHHTIFIGAACALGAVPASLMERLHGIPFLAVAVATTAVSVVCRRRMESSRRAEEAALAAAGAQTYLGFHLQRVDELLSGARDRRRLAELAEEHRRAVDDWRRLCGDVAVEWALARRERITATACRRAEDPDAGTGVPGAPLRGVGAPELAHVLVARLADLRRGGARGESLPLVLDEPLAGVDHAVKLWMLELIGRAAGTPQVVYLTEDDDVEAWARMEATTGEVALIEPSPGRDVRAAVDLGERA